MNILYYKMIIISSMVVMFVTSIMLGVSLSEESEGKGVGSGILIFLVSLIGVTFVYLFLNSLLIVLGIPLP